MKTQKMVLLIVIGFFLISAAKLADDILERLGIEAHSAQYSILSNFIGRFDNGPMDDGVGEKTFQVPYVKLLPSIVAGDKTGAAKDLCVYIKNYINSEEFIKSYYELKEDALPLRDPQDLNGRSLSILKKEVKVFGLNIKNYPNDVAYVTEQKKLKDQAQSSIDYIMSASKNQFPNKEVWEKTYPENPEVMVKKRLQDYLALVKTVDFNAKLTVPDKYKIQQFVNPVYERKNHQWKACFRAGKEVNDVFTSFVQEWLKGEIIATVKTKMPDASVSLTEQTKAKATANKALEENTTSQVSDTSTEPEKKDSIPVQNKVKKSLLGKMKAKAKAIIKD